ncbi:ferritin family protein [Oceanispirochaeta sp.]|jgi:rubrerythrin|uniref:ferritin family protein n=1 Tax=Oceanispirochaeta sp. TaxID=2035350 RepID=UPI00261D9380|nr:ferritin family protein [Oceanispirochaeta sp.]MDA3958886.1 ferritin family protein [Oceanispirochaeta sp.]
MDIFEFSIQMEHDAEELYRTLASKTEQTGIKKIFTMLADDEVKHAHAVEVLQKKMDTSAVKGSMKEVQTIFASLKKESVDGILSKDLLVELRRALEIEKKGKEFYEEQFSKFDTEAGRKLFKSLSRQEEYHYMTVNNLIELVEKPEWWVENAEFTPKGDDYY